MDNINMLTIYAYRTHAQCKAAHDKNANYIEPKEFEKIIKSENYRIMEGFDEKSSFVPR